MKNMVGVGLLLLYSTCVYLLCSFGTWARDRGAVAALVVPMFLVGCGTTPTCVVEPNTVRIVHPTSGLWHDQSTHQLSDGSWVRGDYRVCYRGDDEIHPVTVRVDQRCEDLNKKGQ